MSAGSRVKTVDQYYVGSKHSIQKWWRQNYGMIKDMVKGLISTGRLELIMGECACMMRWLCTTLT
ncbi:hypothetical protein E2562_021862 [Oryza meyeriana var. granulata]|uniref:Uncharacterized protein n=1 Tax=Oryza meyeriana var. granulata TaxID=110450 RepID=A0A6G1C6P2_9ORYZ|nr:hypothetical protein E2562_021862 [Oryza meyeriana var. granulata]KAF0896326.1 hypothetical protein E2562_021862 [Oryza meyeriana var. granulata]